MDKIHNDELISLFFSTGRLIHDRFKEERGQLNISVLQRETLKFIKENKNPLMKEVADYLCITRPSATVLIDNLAKMKLIRRLPDSHDRRQTRLEATEKVERIICQGKDKFLNLLSSLDEADQRNLIKILKKLSNIISQQNYEKV
ncbi:MAG: MarR family winged helix-turn-helix transcriptional regulator [Candidatus Buchananbacteria bacterium]